MAPTIQENKYPRLWGTEHHLLEVPMSGYLLWLESIECDGYEAKQEGKGIDSNPYPLGSDEYLAWRKGWLAPT